MRLKDNRRMEKCFTHDSHMKCNERKFNNPWGYKSLRNLWFLTFLFCWWTLVTCFSLLNQKLNLNNVASRERFFAFLPVGWYVNTTGVPKESCWRLPSTSQLTASWSWILWRSWKHSPLSDTVHMHCFVFYLENCCVFLSWLSN